MRIKSFKTYQSVEFGKRPRTHFFNSETDPLMARKKGFNNVTIDLVGSRIIIRDHKTREIKIVSETNVAYMEPAEWIEHSELSKPLREKEELDHSIDE